tara:strand:+ start:1002 stop:1721 length:720 start_codon:yes stop_codon:yes gene_type:complete
LKKKINLSDIFGLHKLDGSIEFFYKFNFLIKKNHTVLDVGAGRGAWFFEDKNLIRRNLRKIKGKCKKYIGVDIDEDILDNKSTDINYFLKNDFIIPLKDRSVDVVLCDYVFEHVEQFEIFIKEINRVLKKGGFVCGRTPHKYHYVSIFSKIIPRFIHKKVLYYLQPNRKKKDIFIAYYKLNTMKTIKNNFRNYYDYSYLYTSEPTYYLNNKVIFKFLYYVHRILPEIFTSNIFFFLKKK